MPVTFDTIKGHTTSDKFLQEVIEMVKNGFPQKLKQVPSHLKTFYGSKDILSVVDGVLMIGERVVIPQTLQEHILKSLHRIRQN